MAPPAASSAPPQASASVQAPAKAPPSGAPASARRWRYRGFTEGNTEAAPKTPLTIVLAELEKRTLEKGLEVTVLGVEINGVLVDAEQVRTMQLEGAPFSSFPTRWVLLRDGRKKAPQVWLLEGHSPVTDEALKKAQTERSTFNFNARVPRFQALGRLPGDSPIAYLKQIGGLESRCEGYEHPAPESGDYYFSERCYNDGVGLTQLVFSSVWGGYHFEQETPGSGK